MEKELNYLIEFIAKSDDVPIKKLYGTIHSTLNSLEMCVVSKYSQTQIQAIMNKAQICVPQNIFEAFNALDSLLAHALPKELEEAKQKIFLTLVSSNFPKKRVFLEHSIAFFISQLEPVEKQIYEQLLSYIVGINRAFGIFSLLHKDCVEQNPEHFIDFGTKVHEVLLEMLFNDEEQALLQASLKELLGVYLGLYGKYLYM